MAAASREPSMEALGVPLVRSRGPGRADQSDHKEFGQTGSDRRVWPKELGQTILAKTILARRARTKGAGTDDARQTAYCRHSAGLQGEEQ